MRKATSAQPSPPAADDTTGSGSPDRPAYLLGLGFRSAHHTESSLSSAPLADVLAHAFDAGEDDPLANILSSLRNDLAFLDLTVLDSTTQADEGLSILLLRLHRRAETACELYRRTRAYLPGGAS
jgi:hypothetical protein